MSELYYYSTDGQAQHGPVSKDDLRAIGLSPRALVWCEGMTNWREAHTVPDLADLFVVPMPVIAPATTAPTPVALAHVAPASTGLQSLQSSLGPANAPLNYQGPPVYTPTSGNTNGMAVASMVLGIISVTALCVYGLGALPAILAIIFGHMARKQIAQSGEQGHGMATAGLVLGYIVVGIVGAVILIFLAIVIVAGIVAANH